MKTSFAIPALLFALPAMAQTTVTATIQDSDGQAWNNGHGFATFMPGPINSYQCASTITSPTNFTLDGTGTFTTSLADNSLCTPAGSSWTFTICPNASAKCFSKQIIVVGTSENLSTQLSAASESPRFPATSSVQSYGYLDGEVTPIPVPGGWYFNVTSQKGRQWNGTAWQDFAGGASTPCPTVNTIQISNVSSFNCDTNFTINPTTHTRISTANDVVNAVTSIPRAVYDPMDTRFSGGLAAAIAGTSGFTPTQVLQATADFAECQTETAGAGPGWIITPANTVLNVDGFKLWTSQRLGAESESSQTRFGHVGNTGPMITEHGPTDTIVCNGTTFTPGQPSGVEMAFFAISGNFTGTNDRGIVDIGFNSYIHDIGGWGQQFGMQAIEIEGEVSYSTRIGFPGVNIAGCALPPRGLASGPCASVQLDQLDGFADHIYATDGAFDLPGKGPGSCYPQCAAIEIAGNGMVGVEALFAQLSDVGVHIQVPISGSNWRIDASSMEGVRIDGEFGGGILNNIGIGGPCTSTSLQAAFNAGTATGCFGLVNQEEDWSITDVSAGAEPGVFGPSFIQAAVGDQFDSAAGISNTYKISGYQGSPSNTTANGWAITAIPNLQAGGRAVFWNAGPPMAASTTAVNISGITHINLSNGLTVESFTGGMAGQRVTVIGAPLLSPGVPATATIDVGGNFISCSGFPETVTTLHPIDFIVDYFTGQAVEVCNSPNQTPTHVNFFGQGSVPSNPSLLHVIGDTQSSQAPSFTIDSGVQLHGPTVSGQACFEQVATFPDNSRVVSDLVCTNVNLVAQTGGEIFVVGQPQATMSLYLVSNAQGNGVPIGKYPAPTGTLWDGPTTIAAGGDGSTAPPANDNTTGLNISVGDIPTCPNPLPTCSAGHRSICVVPGTGSTADVWQRCVFNGSAFAWTTF